MNLTRLGLVFAAVFGVIAVMELRWFLEIYGTLVLIPIAIFAGVVIVVAVLLRQYVDPPTSLADGEPDKPN